MCEVSFWYKANDSILGVLANAVRRIISETRLRLRDEGSNRSIIRKSLKLNSSS